MTLFVLANRNLFVLAKRNADDVLVNYNDDDVVTFWFCSWMIRGQFSLFARMTRRRCCCSDRFLVAVECAADWSRPPVLRPSPCWRLATWPSRWRCRLGRGQWAWPQGAPAPPARSWARLLLAWLQQCNLHACNCKFARWLGEQVSN
jgi:hypothetical protein